MNIYVAYVSYIMSSLIFLIEFALLRLKFQLKDTFDPINGHLALQFYYIFSLQYIFKLKVLRTHSFNYFFLIFCLPLEFLPVPGLLTR